MNCNCLERVDKFIESFMEELQFTKDQITSIEITKQFCNVSVGSIQYWCKVTKTGLPKKNSWRLQC